MIGLIRKMDGAWVAAVVSTDGYDLTLYDAVELPPGDPAQWKWTGSAFVPRDPTPAEATEAALTDDPRWQAMKAATPQQVENYLAENVTNLAQAREVLKVLILAVQRLARTR